ncbi:MAG: hypothetical protein KH138_01300, partial [Firmicutes bacterium]|nr:hypothetical protein [Bacillota bacterium]
RFLRSSIFHHPEPFYHINAKKPSWAGLFRQTEGTTAQRWAVVPFSPAKQIPFPRSASDLF